MENKVTYSTLSINKFGLIYISVIYLIGEGEGPKDYYRTENNKGHFKFHLQTVKGPSGKMPTAVFP